MFITAVTIFKSLWQNMFVCVFITFLNRPSRVESYFDHTLTWVVFKKVREIWHLTKLKLTPDFCLWQVWVSQNCCSCFVRRNNNNAVPISCEGISESIMMKKTMRPLLIYRQTSVEPLFSFPRQKYSRDTQMTPGNFTAE